MPLLSQVGVEAGKSPEGGEARVSGKREFLALWASKLLEQEGQAICDLLRALETCWRANDLAEPDAAV